MSDPVLRSPLEPFDLAREERARDTSRGVWANEVSGLGFVSLRGRIGDAAFVEAASAALGMPLPIEPCAMTVAGGATTLWLSPDEWLIVASRVSAKEIARALDQALAGVRCQITDNSGGFTQIALEGSNAAQALAHASVYDIAALGPGRVVGTTFGKSSLYLYRHGDGFRLIVRRSFADYIWRYLVRAAAPYSFGVHRLEAKDAA